MDKNSDINKNGDRIDAMEKFNILTIFASRYHPVVD